MKLAKSAFDASRLSELTAEELVEEKANQSQIGQRVKIQVRLAAGKARRGDGYMAPEEFQKLNQQAVAAGLAVQMIDIELFRRKQERRAIAADGQETLRAQVTCLTREVDQLRADKTRLCETTIPLDCGKVTGRCGACHECAARLFREAQAHREELGEEVGRLTSVIESIEIVRASDVAERDRAIAESSRLRELIKKAPHGSGCAWLPFAGCAEPPPCDCWKATALGDGVDHVT